MRILRSGENLLLATVLAMMALLPLAEILLRHRDHSTGSIEDDRAA